MNWMILKVLLPLGVVGGALTAYFVLSRKKVIQPLTSFAPTLDKRSLVVHAALGEVSLGDPQKYWNIVAPGKTVAKGTSWCGGFALWALKQAGLAKDIFWEFGKGFLYHLPITHTPQPGDIAYIDKPYQHHAVVQAVSPTGTVSLINGNGTDGKVSLSDTPMSHVTAFYSIQPLLGA